MPRGIPRFKKVKAGDVIAAVVVMIDGGGGNDQSSDGLAALNALMPPAENELPRGWAKGAHLNVRNVGHEYRITLFPEEFDPLQPERCLKFTNTATCQQFVSEWYMRESHDPRAR